MAQIGRVEISDTAVNLHGEVGTGFTVSSPALREETIIDPKTGEFIGTRATTLQNDTIAHIPAGTVINLSAVHRNRQNPWRDTPLTSSGPSRR